MITNALGQVKSRRDFMPFGEEVTPDANYRTASLTYTSADNVRQKFTGYQKDDETGLDFAEARMYENRHGRFTAVDPLLASGKSANPQTFNRFVYCLNNPLLMTDGTGLQAGQWYYAADSSGAPINGADFKYIANGAVTDGYRLIPTSTNMHHQLIVDPNSFGLIHHQHNGNPIDPTFASIRLNPNGPISDGAKAALVGFRGEQGMAPLSDYDRWGIDIVPSDQLLMAFFRSGAVYDASIETLFAVDGAIGAGETGLSLAGKGAMEEAIGGSEGEGENLLLRTMKVGDDGLPQTGSSATTLGIRPRDIPNGPGPGLGGMSVTPEGGILPNLGGRNTATFCILCRDLGPNLSYRPDPLNLMNHGFVEANKVMSKEEFEQALWGTRPQWSLYDPR